MDKTGELTEIESILQCISKNKNFLLSGGAGSGKTYSLVETINEIFHRSPAASIACITYTNAAAIEIRNRTESENLWVSTIHDFFWSNISQYQKELKETLLDEINNPDGKIKVQDVGEKYQNDFVNGIQYKEYLRIRNGEISHDEVLVLANRMYSKYIKLCDILKDKYEYILVDEYQDTSPLVIEILLDFLSVSKKSNIIGFFGDSMQAIYETGVGDLDKYIHNGQVIEIKKEENRRNPLSVITLANKLRTDGLSQKPSRDNSAPNMEDGNIVNGKTTFIYDNEMSLERIKNSKWCEEWDFLNSLNTKELRLTHNLIASEAGFKDLMDIYDNDPIMHFKNEVKKQVNIQEIEISANDTFEVVVKKLTWKYARGENAGRNKTDVFLEDKRNILLYEYIKNWPYEKVLRIYLDKDSLIDDKKKLDNVISREPKRDKLIQHLFLIQELLELYQNNQYNEVIRRTSFKFKTMSDKEKLSEKVKKLISMKTSTIEQVIDYADKTGICKKDDRLENFITSNEYLYWRVKDVSYVTFQNLYKYLEGYIPLSTQHKIKGLEYKNVLVVLHNGGWSNYNFEYLLDENIYDLLTPAKKKTYPDILLRTKKLFYVCCTRAIRNLIVFCPSPTEGMISGAEKLFGKENVFRLEE